MVEIEFSTIPDADIDLQVLASLLADFSDQSGIKVRIHPMTWGTAWTDMVGFTSHGKGPDLSHVGGTWVSSLATMNALRPFAPKEIDDLDGSNVFLPAIWQSGTLLGDNRVWSVPWTGYIYVICYRKDLLRQAGIDSEKAFGTAASLLETVKELRYSHIEMPWLLPYIPPPYSDLVHIAASWIWEAGGDYMDDAGQRVLFGTADALHGLKMWLELYRAVPDAYAHLGFAEVRTMFERGRAAMIVADNRYAASVLLGNAETTVKENMGITTLTSVPWFGGGSFIIWHHTQGYPERARAAVQLIKYLTGKEAQLQWARKIGSIPARLDVLKELYPPEHPLHAAFDQAVRSGRTYRSIPLWRRLEHQIAQALNACVQEGREKPSMDAEEILRNHLVPLAERLNLTLEG